MSTKRLQRGTEGSAHASVATGIEELPTKMTRFLRNTIVTTQPLKKMSFLDLPGEPRNFIYEYCIEDKETVGLHLPSRIKRHYGFDTTAVLGSVPHIPVHIRKALRQFNKLTQTCRQVRAEFVPNYLANSHICVHLRDLQAYLADFYPMGLAISTNDFTEVAKYQGNIVIDHQLQGIPFTSDRPSERLSVNLLPLLQLYSRARGFKCEFDSSPGSWTRAAWDMNMLLSTHEKFLCDYQLRTDNIAAIYLSHRSCASFEPFVKIVFKKSAWSPWIARRPTTPMASEDPEKYALFLVFLGEVGMSGTRVIAVATREEPARPKKTGGFLWEIRG